jgi:hypothetical protein
MLRVDVDAQEHGANVELCIIMMTIMTSIGAVEGIVSGAK